MTSAIHYWPSFSLSPQHQGTFCSNILQNVFQQSHTHSLLPKFFFYVIALDGMSITSLICPMIYSFCRRQEFNLFPFPWAETQFQSKEISNIKEYKTWLDFELLHLTGLVDIYFQFHGGKWSSAKYSYTEMKQNI